MKNLPDDELFNGLESRLRNYDEQPDDAVWDRITAKISPAKESAWMMWSDKLACGSLVMLLLTMTFLKDAGVHASTDTSLLSEQSLPKQHEVVKEQSVQLDTSTLLKSTLSPLPANKESASNALHITEMEYDRILPVAGSGSSAAKTAKPEVDQFDSSSSGALSNHYTDSTRVISGEQDAVVADSSATIEYDSVASEVANVVPRVKRHKKSKLTFYVLLNPSLSFQHVSPYADDKVIFQKLNSPGVLSLDRLGFSLEGGIQGRITSRLQYIAGASFYYQSQHLKYTLGSSDVTLEPLDDQNGYVVNPITTEHTFQYDMFNVGAQAGLLYTIKQTGLIHKAGVVLNYQQGLQRASREGGYDNSSSHYLSYQLMYRLEYPVHSNLHFFVQPNYSRTFISHEALDAPFRLKQSRAGIGVGLVFRF